MDIRGYLIDYIRAIVLEYRKRDKILLVLNYPKRSGRGCEF
jgi:hypothetical protein